MPASLLVSLDVLSAVLTVLIAAFFLRVWTRSRLGLDLLAAIGFALLGVSYLATTPSTLDLGGPFDSWEYPRLGGQVGGALVIAAAYASARVYGRARPFLAVGWTAAALGVLLIVAFFVVPPFAELPSLSQMYPVAHAIMALAWLGSALMASRSWANRRTLTHALVPLAYASFALSKYTWLVIDLSSDKSLVLFIYAWRFLAIALLGLALLLPRPAREGVPIAPAA